MIDTRRSKPQLEIPDGLEVVTQEGLEFNNHDAPEVVQAYHNDKEMKSYHPQEPRNLAGDEQQTPQPHSHRRRRRNILIAVAVGLVVVIAIVVGAVVGSRAAQNNSHSSTSSESATPTTSTSTSATPEPSATSSLSSVSLRDKSALSVTGWTSGSEYSIRVFYQGGDGKIRLSSYESTAGEWGAPDVLDIQGRNDTPLGASSIAEPFYFGFTDDKSGFQVELFYLSNQNIFQEWTFKDAVMGNGSASPLGITLSSTSKIVSYWPSVIYQSATGDLQEIVLSGSWNIKSMGNTALSGGGLVVIPLQSNYPDGGNHVFFQRDDNTMVEITGNSSAGWSTAQPVVSIPKGSSIGAFGVLNKRKAPKLDTYVLYQDAHGTIQVVWQDDETGWKGPTAPPAFEAADNGTSIACFTPIAWPGTSLGQDDLQTCRCYYQSAGSIKEVRFTGTGWQQLGEVPTT